MEKDYDDREITLTSEEKFMLSDLTERERNIYFEGVDEGFDSGLKIMWIFISVAAIIVLGTILATQ